MQCITKRRLVQLVLVRWQILVVLSLLVLALGSQMPDSVAGWWACPPRVVSGAPVLRRRGRCASAGWCPPASSWRQLGRTMHLPLLRSGLLWSLWSWGGVVGPVWVCLIPWGLWGWQSAGVLWPQLRRQPEWRGGHWLLWQVQRLLLVGYLGLALRAWWQGQASSLAWPKLEPADLGPGSGVLGLGCVVPSTALRTGCGREEPWVEVVPEADGSYTATLCGHFTWRVQGDHPFRARVLMHGLRALEVPGPQRSGRRTRDGRTPFVAQEQLAIWFQLPQPDSSRQEQYWLTGDWANLLSLQTAEPLTNELRARIVKVCAAFPWWGVQRVYHHRREQGVLVSERQVRQAVEQSGWTALRQELLRRYQVTAEGSRPRDEWLVTELLTLVTTLLEKLEAGTGLTPEEQLAVADLQALVAEAGLRPQPPLKPLPWLLQVERVLFGHWDVVTDGAVRCIRVACGSTQVVRKSNQPRWKKYYDEAGDLQTVAVYRYYCRNAACDKDSFTNLPPGLVPYSRYRTATRLLSLQMYAWGYSTYRRTGTALGVTSMTAYRWVSAWGYELLPVAALFGVVQSSGVVGVDEKYVLVPKNDKPASKMRRWMYVYLAVDVYTYDLLHIAIYPYNNKDSARTFLLALRAKGYHPTVLVTDLRQDYGGVMAQVFPKARHHECIFHALQDVQQHFKDIYGAQYAETQPEAAALQGQIDHIFAAKTKRTAQKRYDQVLAVRNQYVQATPGAVAIFDFLEQHWPTLVNGVESTIIPRTNNAVELVIRRFDQHYQSFCGFDTIESARLFLGVFEKVYRFTPFSCDAQPRIRGKCPLELAGYDISQMPMAFLCAGSSFAWPLEPTQEEVPKQ